MMVFLSYIKLKIFSLDSTCPTWACAFLSLSPIFCGMSVSRFGNFTETIFMFTNFGKVGWSFDVFGKVKIFSFGRTE